MALAVVQNKIENNGGYDTSHAISFASNVTAGSLIVVCISSQGAAITGISDNQGNSYTQIQTGDNGSDLYGRMYYSDGSNSGATTITVTFADYVDSIIGIYEISGAESSSALDVSAEYEEGDWVTSHPTGTTGATSQDDEIAVAMYTGDDNFLSYAATGYTLQDLNGDDSWSSMATAYKILSSTGTQSATFTSGATAMNGYACIGCFKQAAAAGTLISYKTGGSFASDKTINFKSGGSFAEKELKVKVGGSF